MAQTSVAQFASELKVPPSVLLEQLRAAGVDKKQPDDALTEQDKSRLLEYLRKMHGSAEQKNKITLTRKHTSEIKKTDATGKYRTVQVEVRKKRVFVKRDPAEVAAAGGRGGSAAARRRRAAPGGRRQGNRAARGRGAPPAAAGRAAGGRAAREAGARAQGSRAEGRGRGGRGARGRRRQPATTLHAPKPATGDAKTDKKPKKAKTTTVLRDDSVRRRQIKTRGDSGGGVGGWHARGGGRHRLRARRRADHVRASPPSRWCARWRCRRPSPWASSPTACRSRRPR